MITSMWFRPGDDISVALELRRQVFQEELGLPVEFDQDGLDPYSYHLVLLYNDIPAACGRISYGGVNTGRLSRICVLHNYRRQGIGDGLVKVLDYKASQLGMGRSRVETIPGLEKFFGRIGYEKTGDRYEKYNMSLITMEKETNDGTRENCAHQCAGKKSEG